MGKRNELTSNMSAGTQRCMGLTIKLKPEGWGSASQESAEGGGPRQREQWVPTTRGRKEMGVLRSSKEAGDATAE